MRACFLGQNICALGFGVATLQVPPLAEDRSAKPGPAKNQRDRKGTKEKPKPRHRHLPTSLCNKIATD
jgi:hypothetical protein